jgi:hypothetical protein
VRAEFCEADVLDVFDEWRRALGLPAAMSERAEVHEDGPAEERESRRVSLVRHIERVTSRLITLRGRTDVPARLNEAIGAVIDELDAAYPRAKGARGEARERLIELLNRADAGLIAAARESAGDAGPALRQAADAEIAAYRGRMAANAYAHSLAAATDRLLRQHFALPTLRVDA